MSSLCSNVIKAEDVNLKGKKVIKNLISSQSNVDINAAIASQQAFIEIEEEIRVKLKEADEKCEEIINKAKLDSQILIQKSEEEKLEIEKKAYEQGYNQGIKNGYEDGYKEAYEDNIQRAKAESEEIIDSANNMLFRANEEVIKYMTKHKSNILSLSISIAEQVLRERFEDESSMNKLITNVINEYELKQNFIIKINPLYKDSLDKEILSLKESYSINSDVFVIVDDSIEEGNAVIDNEKGRLIVGRDSVLDKIKEELL